MNTYRSSPCRVARTAYILVSGNVYHKERVRYVQRAVFRANDVLQFWHIFETGAENLQHCYDIIIILIITQYVPEGERKQTLGNQHFSTGIEPIFDIQGVVADPKVTTCFYVRSRPVSVLFDGLSDSSVSKLV